jgi:hypothetical protein
MAGDLLERMAASSSSSRMPAINTSLPPPVPGIGESPRRSPSQRRAR